MVKIKEKLNNFNVIEVNEPVLYFPVLESPSCASCFEDKDVELSKPVLPKIEIKIVKVATISKFVLNDKELFKYIIEKEITPHLRKKFPDVFAFGLFLSIFNDDSYLVGAFLIDSSDDFYYIRKYLKDFVIGFVLQYDCN